MAPVEIGADYRVYNLRSSALENLLHKVFVVVRLKVSQVGIDGRTYNPHEWFVAPLPFSGSGPELYLLLAGLASQLANDYTLGNSPLLPRRASASRSMEISAALSASTRP